MRDARIGVREGEKTLPNFSLAAHDRAGRNEARGRGILTRCGAGTLPREVLRHAEADSLDEWWRATTWVKKLSARNSTAEPKMSVIFTHVD